MVPLAAAATAGATMRDVVATPVARNAGFASLLLLSAGTAVTIMVAMTAAAIADKLMHGMVGLAARCMLTRGWCCVSLRVVEQVVERAVGDAACILCWPRPRE